MLICNKNKTNLTGFYFSENDNNLIIFHFLLLFILELDAADNIQKSVHRIFMVHGRICNRLQQKNSYNQDKHLMKLYNFFLEEKLFIENGGKTVPSTI